MLYYFRRLQIGQSNGAQMYFSTVSTCKICHVPNQGEISGSVSLICFIYWIMGGRFRQYGKAKQSYFVVSWQTGNWNQNDMLNHSLAARGFMRFHWVLRNLTMSHPRHTTQRLMIKLSIQLRQSNNCSKKLNARKRSLATSVRLLEHSHRRHKRQPCSEAYVTPNANSPTNGVKPSSSGSN